MSTISETLKFEMPPKEKILLLAKQIRGRSEFLTEIADYCQGATDADKAICLAAVNQITKDDPTFIQNHMDFVISQIDNKSAQVKLEASEIIASAAKASPDQVVKAIPKLMEITKDEASIVRWGAAYALTEIAKSSDPKTIKQLLRFFKAEAKKEQMSSVRNLYLDALTALGKAK
jgi:diketogulonate reductase-like aldo/keto reductase